MNFRKFTFVLILCFSLIGCSSEPVLSNVRTSKEPNGIQVITEFSKTDAVYIVCDLSNGVKGNVISAKWYGENVQGIEPDYLLNEARIQITQSGPYTLHFDFPAPSGGWLIGTYKVEIYLNGDLNSTVHFTVYE